MINDPVLEMDFLALFLLISFDADWYYWAFWIIIYCLRKK